MFPFLVLMLSVAVLIPSPFAVTLFCCCCFFFSFSPLEDFGSLSLVSSRFHRGVSMVFLVICCVLSTGPFHLEAPISPGKFSGLFFVPWTS